jgi:hypothetical protein
MFFLRQIYFFRANYLREKNCLNKIKKRNFQVAFVKRVTLLIRNLIERIKAILE